MTHEDASYTRKLNDEKWNFEFSFFEWVRNCSRNAFMLAAATDVREKTLNWRINEILSGLIIVFTWIDLASWQHALNAQLRPPSSDRSLYGEVYLRDINRLSTPVVKTYDCHWYRHLNRGNFIARPHNFNYFRAVINTVSGRKTAYASDENVIDIDFKVVFLLQSKLFVFPIHSSATSKLLLNLNIQICYILSTLLAKFHLALLARYVTVLKLSCYFSHATSC